MKLRPYQSEACRKIVGQFEKGINRTLLILPTGTGKTVVFNGVAFRYAYNPDRTPNGGRVLVMAHQNILIEQARDKFSSVLGIETSREKGKIHCQDSDLPITVSSMQTMKNRLKRFPHDYFDLIIIDEAHHIMSAGYQQIIEHFDKAKILGVTATPDRADGKRLTVFESIAYEYTIKQAQDDGYLAPIKVVKSPLAIDLNRVRKRQGDMIGSDLGDAIEPHLHEIAKEVARLAKGRRTVCFVPLIRTAKKAAEIFSHYGFRSEWTAGEDPDKDEKLKDFEAGEYDIIFNSMLLTEGWDCPETDCVIVLRPTMSRALYVQMIGRGLRLAKGKEDCLLVDFLFQHEDFDLASPENVLKEKDLSFSISAGGGNGEGHGEEPEDAESRLIRKLREAGEKYAKDKNPFVEYAEVLEHIPESELFDPGLTKSQEKKIKALGVIPVGLLYGQAKAILEYEDSLKPVSDKMSWRLKKLGYSAEEIEGLNFLQAKKIIRQQKAMGRW